MRSPIPSKLVANMIEKAGAEHIMMLDPHSPQLVGFFNIPVDALKVKNIVVNIVGVFIVINILYLVASK